jgi:hypothetical protein
VKQPLTSFLCKVRKLHFQIHRSNYHKKPSPTEGTPTVNLNAVVDTRLLQKKLANAKSELNREMLSIQKEFSIDILK